MVHGFLDHDFAAAKSIMLEVTVVKVTIITSPIHPLSSDNMRQVEPWFVAKHNITLISGICNHIKGLLKTVDTMTSCKTLSNHRLRHNLIATQSSPQLSGGKCVFHDDQRRLSISTTLLQKGHAKDVVWWSNPDVEQLRRTSTRRWRSSTLYVFLLLRITHIIIDDWKLKRMGMTSCWNPVSTRPRTAYLLLK